MVFTIGEMAKKLGVAASTLRYYDKEGLFPFWSDPKAVFVYLRKAIMNLSK